MKVLAVVGPTATGKTALALDLADAFGGEIISCDSTAVYRGIDIGTDKPPLEERRGIAHHLIDVADPTEVYSAARYAREAASAIRDITRRGRRAVLVGGTGFYYRALFRGLFPGPERDEALRARLDRIADRRDVLSLHRWLARVDPPSALRIQPRDRKRLIRALEVYVLTGRTLTAHFAETTSPLPEAEVLALGLVLPRPALRARVAARVDAQFARGVVSEVERAIAAGVPATANALGGLVYRQIMEMRRGVRDLAATRDLIVQENMRYARRQLTWFAREPGVRWLDGAGESDATRARARGLAREFLGVE